MEEGLSDSVLQKIKTPETQKIIETTNGDDISDRSETRQKLLQSLSNPINIDNADNVKIISTNDDSELSDRERTRIHLKGTLHDRADTTNLE